MAPRKGNMMTVRNDIKVLDATIRDGGLCNNFEFTDEFVTELYKTNIKSGVDYMEFGYRASKKMFDPEKFGKWKFCTEEDIRSIVGDNISDMKISVMADVGRCDFKEDFIPKSESVIDMVRVACYIHQIPAAVEMVEHFHNLGYETTCNIMAVSQANTDQVAEALEMLGNSSVDVIYLVDSYGSLYPETAEELAKKYLEAGEKYGKAIGFHAHNNQNLAFANTIETMSYGVSYLDATAMGMGRGAGNCAKTYSITGWRLGWLIGPAEVVENAKKVHDFLTVGPPPPSRRRPAWGFASRSPTTGSSTPCTPASGTSSVTAWSGWA